MEAVMKLKRSNLVLPTSGYELDREEMCYVEGGLYLSNSFCSAIVGFTAMLGCFGWGVTIASGSTAIISAMITGAKIIGTKILLGLNAFMGANPIFYVLGVAVIALTLLNFNPMIEACMKIVFAAFQGKGVEIYFKWFQLKSTIY